MAENTTRISDLPDNIQMTYNTDEPVQNPTYKPMNVHPNPYGNGVTPDVMPQQEHARPPPLSDEQKRMLIYIRTNPFTITRYSYGFCQLSE